MKLSKTLLAELQKRLKVGNRRGVHLNAIPKNSAYKLDIANLSIIRDSLPNEFIECLLTKNKFNFEISWRDIEIDLFGLDIKEQKKYITLGKSFEHILNQVETIKSEKGIETFGFGFPLLIRRDRLDKKLTIAPLLIWQLELRRSKKNDTWEIIRSDDASVNINEVLANHLKSDSNIEINQIPNEMLEDNVITKNELFEICYDILKDTNVGDKKGLKENLDKAFGNIIPITAEDDLKHMAFNDSNALINYSGLFSYFEIQKNNIIKDYDELIKLAGEEIIQDDYSGNSFQPITSISTDPTQQNVLNSLENTRDLVIQGPPGTGKSQTLTAILVNALENKKKTIVVCEKNTALEVLQSSLKKIGLDQHSILIHDIATDRKKVVTSVRDRIQNIDILRDKYGNSKFTYDSQLKNINNLIDKVNKKHKLLDARILANYNWTDVVGMYLKQLRKYSEDDEVKINPKFNFNFNFDEFNNLNNLVIDAQRLFKSRLNNKVSRMLPEHAYESSSFYNLEDSISEAFIQYQNLLNEVKKSKDTLYDEYVNYRHNLLGNQLKNITKILDNLDVLSLNLTDILLDLKTKFIQIENQNFDIDFNKYADQRELLRKLELKYKNNIDFKNEEKLLGFSYNVTSLFSKNKKQTIIDFKQFNSVIEELNDTIKSSKFISCLNYENTILSKLNAFSDFYEKTESLKTQFNESTEQKFNELDLNYLAKLETEEKLIEHINLLKSRINLSHSEKLILNDIYREISDYFSSQKEVYKNLELVLKTSPDFNIDFHFVNNHIDNDNQIQKVKKRIQDINSSIQNTIDFEFLNADIFEDEAKFNHLPIYNQLKNILDQLHTRILSDGYIANYSKSKNLNALINSVEYYLDQKKLYVEENSDAFRADYNWFSFFNKLDDGHKEIIESLSNCKDWSISFSIYYFNKLLRCFATDDLPSDQFLIDDLFLNEEKLQTNQINFINDVWYKEQYLKLSNFDKSNTGVKVKNLYNVKGSSGHRRYSLRNIIECDIDLFTSFFPIVLTTPDIASNLFKYNNRYFDIVLFDEASQLRLEDNLPAMLKGKQIVIAGDEHQMPPSNYFSKIYNGDIESEDEIVEDDSNIIKDKSTLDSLALSCSSLLEFGSEMSFKTKYLDFHYRSKHPYLIEFSNFAFYKQKLKALPQIFDYKSISYINVGGIFQNSINEKEADVVLSILENNINQKKDGSFPTIGIATFNIAQRDLIKAKIDERKKQEKYKEFNSKILELEKNGLFVKNLENIQGDERDVIIISTTYGKDVSGTFYERLGPINFEKGYKLLNVIITRAKYKNYIVTSIPEEKILKFKDYLVTQGSNNKKASLYAYLAYAKGVSEGNEDLRLGVLDALKSNYNSDTAIDIDLEALLESPFEKEVYERLIQVLEKKHIILQYKVGGFRIDMVIDFNIQGVPKIAIECDGAKYHSSNQAYLYDMHRQRILESQGFVFHRIWGTNWWRNQKVECQKLLKFIEEIKNSAVENIQENKNSMVSSFTGEIIFTENNSNYIDAITTEELLESKISNDIISISDVNDSRIILGSEVKIKFLRDNTSQYFKIVNKEQKDIFISDKIKPLSVESPLGKAILNKSIGNTAKIEGLDRFVEILMIK